MSNYIVATKSLIITVNIIIIYRHFINNFNQLKLLKSNNYGNLQKIKQKTIKNSMNTFKRNKFTSLIYTN